MFNHDRKVKIEDLGYSEFFEAKGENLELTGFSIARVIAEYREAYRVKSVNGEFLAKITGKQMFDAARREDYPAVGDWLVVTELDGGRAVIRKILPRKSILKKKYSDKQDTQIIATNIDIAFVIESVDRDYNLNRFERYIVLANEGKIRPVVILNKIDLISITDLNSRIDQITNRFNDVDIIPTSTITEQGLNELENYIIKGKTYCFLGSSGVGKSSLINKLLKKNEIKTKEISTSTGKGKHTTTTREMYFLENGGIVIDNPGTREVGIADAIVGIENVFDEITYLSKKCKFSDCTHTNEPSCAILRAIEDKKLDENKYQNYIKLKKEAEYYQMNELEKREKDRKFGRFVKKALKQLNEFKS
ncbi:ribosome small subunit-dependent GTPase A [Candidatus Gottesmanbacteria bacterium RIFCSPHIGHO2_02_FULL_39_11]|uniref:Small ribosomal subunit biogenesis GTPase RsgA n=1 Tax=Candidatus Gottesmanbacteria bacterium RIFCSPHIGHO2_02_FULL_39_11 TaxID=1798382 RepID=A0A1F5ZTJ1_9BACT|nr:MAG: ribosome small subunit-dependent GTPase A [Candidatus Gottesmanbacteria bacterium RIFCSPHIGHO2_02_FULL_39_11]